MKINDPHDFTVLTQGNSSSQSDSQNNTNSTSEKTVYIHSTPQTKGHGPLCRFLLAIGSAITFVRNFVFNLIFLILALLVFCSLCLVNSDKSNSSLFADEPDNEIHPLLSLNLDGPVKEMPASEDEYAKVLRNLNESLYNVKEHDVLSIEKALKKAESDERIKALYVNLSNLGPTSLGAAIRIRDAIESFRIKKGDNSVVVFARYYTPAAYLIATGSKNIAIDPLGGFTFKGFSTSQLYVADMLERFKIEPLVFRAGAYKSAVEPLISNHMSDEVKAEYQQIFDYLWDYYIRILSEKVPSSRQLKEIYKDDTRYLYMLKKLGSEASLLKKFNLVNEVINEINLKTTLITSYGKSKNSFFEPKYTDYTRLLEKPAGTPEKTILKNPTKATIAVIYGIDEITDKSDDVNAFTPASIKSQLEQACKDPNLKGIVLYLNSGGGSVTASEDIRILLEKMKKRGIRIYVSMNSLTASGAYWISTVAHKLFATESTITGSIGVFAVTFGTNRLLNEYGVYEDGVQTSTLEMNSLGRSMPASQKEAYAIEVNSIYQNFLSLVKNSRPRMTRTNKVENYAEGRVFTAKQALNLHMIDEIGDLNSVIASLSSTIKKGQIKTVEVKHYAPQSKDNLGFLKSIFSGSVSAYIPNQYLKILFNTLVKHDSTKAEQRAMIMALTPYEVKF